jgi:hypothetical protein
LFFMRGVSFNYGCACVDRKMGSAQGAEGKMGTHACMAVKGAGDECELYA